MLTFRAHSDGTAIVPDEPVEIPGGKVLRVTVEEVSESEPAHSSREALLQIARAAEQVPVQLPVDLAGQLDHYLYGASKR